MFWSRRHIGRLAPLFVGAGLPVEVIPHEDSDALLLDLVFALGQLIHQLLQADLLVLVDELPHLPVEELGGFLDPATPERQGLSVLPEPQLLNFNFELRTGTATRPAEDCKDCN